MFRTREALGAVGVPGGAPRLVFADGDMRGGGEVGEERVLGVVLPHAGRAAQVRVRWRVRRRDVQRDGHLQPRVRHAHRIREPRVELPLPQHGRHGEERNERERWWLAEEGREGLR